ncbi:class II aldolase/adducin family protein [Pseudoduganella umbonata]|uniref:Class II aldolase/adducin family protein n=1 Tax=Pseudoduganella umbonata TaxID=864828 RepID=A0A4P8HYP2_9BURK|nr:class II aldolase/adducin family protein [Pseudoduganella umbonata]MBB3224016.1 ribulose-5-phosphate 4-epimerase/fuculose-1-phosphate aldolase [Pseudoduganella umbonata]QCP14108.1 class II aldolase/adducin family protein [Pseudoduganella umbonata]
MTNANIPVAPVRELSDFGVRARFEIQQAHALLRDWGTLSTRGKGAFNAAVRAPGTERLVIGDAKQAALVTFDGELVEGELNRGLQEVIGVYAALFRERADLQAALHTHSPYLTAHAIAHKPFRINYWSVAKRAGVEEIPLADFAPRYAPEPIIKSLREHPDAPATLLRNRGLFTWGKGSIGDVARLLNSLEEAAEINVYAAQIGGARPLPEGALDAFIAQRKG